MEDTYTLVLVDQEETRLAIPKEKLPHFVLFNDAMNAFEDITTFTEEVTQTLPAEQWSWIIEFCDSKPTTCWSNMVAPPLAEMYRMIERLSYYDIRGLRELVMQQTVERLKPMSMTEIYAMHPTLKKRARCAEDDYTSKRNLLEHALFKGACLDDGIVQEMMAMVPCLKRSLVAAGHDFSMMVTKENKLYASGMNGYAFEEVDPEVERKYQTTATPKLVPFPNVISVWCGTSFVVVLTCDCSLFRWSRDAKPENITPREAGSIIDVACGSTHIIMHTADGRVYGYDTCYYGGGVPETQTLYETKRITEVDHLSVAGIAVGISYSLFLTKDGSVYAYGAGQLEVLGTEAPWHRSLLSKVSLPNYSRCVAVASGYYHCLFLLEDGTLYGSGHNNQGQLGLGVTNAYHTVTKLAFTCVKSISASSRYSMVTLLNGEMYRCGRYSIDHMEAYDTSACTPQKICLAGVTQGVVSGDLSFLFTADALYAQGISINGEAGVGGYGILYQPEKVMLSMGHETGSEKKKRTI